MTDSGQPFLGVSLGDASAASASQGSLRGRGQGAAPQTSSVDHGAIVGQVWLNTIHKVPNPIAELERHGYLSNLYVKPAERGGIGTQLVGAVVAWARASDIDRVVLWPSTRSVTLYLRFGFTHGGDVMELSLGGVSRPKRHT